MLSLYVVDYRFGRKLLLPVRDLDELRAMAGGHHYGIIDLDEIEAAGQSWWLVAATCPAEALRQYQQLRECQHLRQDDLEWIHAQLRVGLDADLAPLFDAAASPLGRGGMMTVISR